MDQPPEDCQAGQVDGDAGREDDRGRDGRWFVVPDDGQPEAGGDQHNAAQDWHECISKRIQRQPRFVFALSRVERRLCTVVIATEVEPPECGGEGKAEQGGHDSAGRQVDRTQANADGDHRLAERDQQNQPVAFDEMAGSNREDGLVDKVGGDPVEDAPQGKEGDANASRRESGDQQEGRRDEVEWAQPGERRADGLLGSQEKPGVHQGHDHVANAESHAAAAEGGGNGECDQEKSTHAHQQQQPDRELAGWDRIGQPGVAPVHPPDVAEEQHHLHETGNSRIAQ